MIGRSSKVMGRRPVQMVSTGAAKGEIRYSEAAVASALTLLGLGARLKPENSMVPPNRTPLSQGVTTTFRSWRYKGWAAQGDGLPMVMAYPFPGSIGMGIPSGFEMAVDHAPADSTTARDVKKGPLAVSTPRIRPSSKIHESMGECSSIRTPRCSRIFLRKMSNASGRRWLSKP